MRKKLLITLLILIISLFSALALSACGSVQSGQGGDEGGGRQTVPEHTHEYSVVHLDATCTESGYEEYTCTCGYRYGSTLLTEPALGHQLNYYTLREATCTQAGWEAYEECTRCDYTNFKEIPAPGHDLSTVPAQVSDCTQTGWGAYEECTRCDYTAFTEVPALGHDLSTVPARQATCTEIGWEEYEHCKRCDYTTYEEIPALGHDLTSFPAREPTCTQTGWEEFEACLRCDYMTYEELPARHGEFVWTPVRSYCAYACLECGYEEQTSLHSFADGTCSVCGVVRNTFLDKFNGTYGYDYFAVLPNGESLCALYSEIDYEVRAFHENGESVGGSDNYKFAEINYTQYGISMTEAINVWKTYRDDNPLYYWLSNKLTCTGEKLKLCTDENYADGATRTAQNEKLYSAILEWTSSVEINSSAYTKTLAFHDMIIQAVDYAYDEDGNVQSASWAHNITGVLEEKGAVCDGYVKTFQLLLNLCGVENIIVTGTGGSEAHAWNLVKLDDGKWYWYDLTWDDTPNAFWGISYDYFASTDADVTFLKTHTASTPTGVGADFLYGLPARSRVDYAATESKLKNTFTTDLFEFTIIAYNLVSVSDIYDTGNVVIPSSVNYGGREYTVGAIGGYNENNGSLWSVGKVIRNAVTSVSIPATVRFIVSSSFSHWEKLEKVTVDENNSAYSSMDGVLFTKDKGLLMLYPNAHEGVSYSIPEQTSMIGYQAFGTRVLSGRKLESLTVHAGVWVVGFVKQGGKYDYIVAGEWSNIANSLTGKQELIIDENNRTYKVINGLIMYKPAGYDGYTAVAGSIPGTETVIFPDNTVEIERDAFNGNNWIRSIVFPEGWKEMEVGLLDYCYALKSITIPASVKKIGKSYFTNNGSVTIYYGGSQKDWDKIEKSAEFFHSYNTSFTIVFGYQQ